VEIELRADQPALRRASWARADRNYSKCHRSLHVDNMAVAGFAIVSSMGIKKGGLSLQVVRKWRRRGGPVCAWQSRSWMVSFSEAPRSIFFLPCPPSETELSSISTDSKSRNTPNITCKIIRIRLAPRHPEFTYKAPGLYENAVLIRSWEKEHGQHFSK
jgi:hypothetical protein